VSYFRGRKLHGKTVKIPEGYKGIILSSTDQKLPIEPQTSEEGEELDEIEQPEDIEIMEAQAEFDEVMVWGHEALPDESTDAYVRGMEEWIAFAEQVGSDPRSQRSTDNLRSIHILHRKPKIRRDPNDLDFDK
jgi:ribonuclease H2 subunit C